LGALCIIFVALGINIVPMDYFVGADLQKILS
jgi:hypothetical protein